MLDCKTVRISAYSSTRFARVRLLRHALPISLLILRKKPDCFAVYLHASRTCFSILNRGGLEKEALLTESRPQAFEVGAVLTSRLVDLVFSRQTGVFLNASIILLIILSTWLG